MSGWFDETARRLAAQDSASSSLTRSAFVRRSSGVALGLVGLGTLAGRAVADDYCFTPCIKAADNNLAACKDAIKSAVLDEYTGKGSMPTLGWIARSFAGCYAGYYTDRTNCRGTNCSDPAKYPKPTEPQLPPGVPCNPLVRSCTCGLTTCFPGTFCGPCSTGSGYPICCYTSSTKRNGDSVCCPD